MNKNDILIRIRYAFHFKNAELIEMLNLGNYSIEPRALINILKKEEEEDFVVCEVLLLNSFLDGFIIKRRGKQEPRPDQKPLPPVEKLTNNIILKKLRIALELRDVDILAILELSKFKVTKTELSALFRRQEHKNYKECGNQFLRNFLVGLALKFRPI
jgi:uncharacterized protein YehS (DUF1456 family)